ncbi:MAG: PA2779 family protein [Bdellovibrionota bacterium]
MIYISRFVIALMISFTLTELPIMKAQAGLISTQEVYSDFNRVNGESTIHNFIARSDVKDKLIELGVDPMDAQKRISSLSDSDVKKLDMDIQKATIAGDIGGILIIVLLVILIIYFAKRI